jgi:electron transfer flavoprotein alpha subunit
MVLVYSDDSKLALELLNKAHELGKELQKKVIAVYIGQDESAKKFFEHGADQVIVIETTQAEFKAEEYTSILQTIMRDH